MSIISEAFDDEGRQLQLTWLPGPVRPPREQTTQASGICFVDGEVVLVLSGSGWGVPGGHPERGESIEDAFAREFSEEATGRITTMAYLGAVQIEEPRVETYYQTRFWARAELQDFQPNAETVERRLLPPAEVAKLLVWKNVAIMRTTLDAAFTVENNRPAGGRDD